MAKRDFSLWPGRVVDSSDITGDLRPQSRLPLVAVGALAQGKVDLDTHNLIG